MRVPRWFLSAPWCWGLAGWSDDLAARVRPFFALEFELGDRAAVAS